jgi:PAS domain S-box-containing protein
VYEANQRFAEMLGYSPKEARQLHVWDWDTQWTREQLLEMVRTVSEAGDHFETYHRRKDGTTFDVEISTNGAMFVGQKLVFCVCRDITERKQAEESLRRSEQNFRDSMENSPLGIRILDIDGKTLYANKALLDMWGYSSIEELEAVPAKQRYTPESYAEHVERVKKGRGENIPLNYEVSIVCSDGQVRHLSASARALLWNGEKRFQAVYQDITEPKQAEGALRRSEEKYRTILSEMQDNYFEVDLAGNLTFFNDSTSNSLGYSAEELMGVSYREFTASEDIKLVYKVFSKVYRTNRPNKGFLWKVVRKDGAVGFVEATVSPLRNPKGEIIGFRGVGRDITERKRAEEERGQFEQKAQIASRLASVGEMAAGIAHEINNPLTSVIGYSQLLSGREDIPEDVKMDLKGIDEGAQRVAGIIKRLLTFARQSRPERTLVSINDLITNTLDLRAYHLRTNNIKVTAKLATDLPLTTADPAQLQQVFLNIIVNAEAEMRQARGRGKLLVKTEEVNGTIRISFKDNGHGIAKENLARIFDPFFTTREVDQGTGLGLSICHGIIAEHKGRIWAESRLGRGATFIVELPIATEDRQPVLLEPAVEEPKKGTKARPRY